VSEGDPPETHYSVLGLDSRATRDQVEQAYRFCLDMYKEGALATYSLLPAEEVNAIRARIAMAYEVLSDPGRRREYDMGLGIAAAAAPLLPFPAPSAPASSPPMVEATVGALRFEDPAGVTPPVPVPAARAVAQLPAQVTGAALRHIREERGIPLREIALASKIGLRFLEYIEEDRVDMLPAPVYLRGFLMEYARVIGLDPRRTAEAYMANLPAKRP
jgi:flagellar biosynthesis protein FlhG